MTKPSDGQAITVDLGYEQQAKLDLTAVANEKMTLVHIGEKLIFLFDNNATVTVEPFFNSMGVPRQDLTVEVPGRDMSSSEFAAVFPITTDQSVLPAAGDQIPASGANFSNASVDPLLSPDPLPLLGPEELPNWQVHFETVPLQEVVLPLVEDEEPPPNGLPSLAAIAQVRLDDEDLTGLECWRHGRRSRRPLNASAYVHDFGPDGAGTVLLSALVPVWRGRAADLFAVDGYGRPDGAGSDVWRRGADLFGGRQRADGEAGAGNTVFTFTLNGDDRGWTFNLEDQLDHPTLDGLPGDNTENELTIILGSLIQATDSDGDTVTAIGTARAGCGRRRHADPSGRQSRPARLTRTGFLKARADAGLGDGIAGGPGDFVDPTRTATTTKRR